MTQGHLRIQIFKPLQRRFGKAVTACFIQRNYNLVHMKPGTELRRHFSTSFAHGSDVKFLHKRAKLQKFSVNEWNWNKSIPKRNCKGTLPLPSLGKYIPKVGPEQTPVCVAMACERLTQRLGAATARAVVPLTRGPMERWACTLTVTARQLCPEGKAYERLNLHLRIFCLCGNHIICSCLQSGRLLTAKHAPPASGMIF